MSREEIVRSGFTEGNKTPGVPGVLLLGYFNSLTGGFSSDLRTISFLIKSST